MENKKRSIVKAISYRLFIALITVTIVFFLTGSLKLAGAISIIEIVAKMTIYYYHERIWQNIEWGITDW